MKEYYHYTLENNIDAILKTGMFPNHPLYTSVQYYSAIHAGQELGVMPHNIDCVLGFRDDGFFQFKGIIPDSSRFPGGGVQYQHPLRIRPITKRKISERSWTKI